MDVLTRAQRRLNMSRIRGRDTKPELFLRRELHARGLRFRLHRRDLPGKPDLVLPRYRVCIFVHGCFWHGHDCGLFRMPATRRDFWQQKITGTRARDRRSAEALLNADWRVLVLWECAMRGPARMSREAIVADSVGFILDPGNRSGVNRSLREIKGNGTAHDTVWSSSLPRARQSDG